MIKKVLDVPLGLVHRKGVSGILRIIRHQPNAFNEARRIVAVSRAVNTPRFKLARFDTAMLLSTPGAKSYTEVKDGDRVTGYTDVKIKGYLSTFGGFDRQGDTVKPGAFKEAIATFLSNPRLLLDHRNSASSVVGSFTTVREDERGLYVEAVLSNSPGEVATDTRWKVAEGHLGALSMGGYFHYESDGRTIFKVDLYEGSIVAIPANASALFTVRAVDADELNRRTDREDQ